MDLLISGLERPNGESFIFVRITFKFSSDHEEAVLRSNTGAIDSASFWYATLVLRKFPGNFSRQRRGVDWRSNFRIEIHRHPWSLLNAAMTDLSIDWNVQTDGAKPVVSLWDHRPRLQSSMRTTHVCISTLVLKKLFGHKKCSLYFIECLPLPSTWVTLLSASN